MLLPIPALAFFSSLRCNFSYFSCKMQQKVQLLGGLPAAIEFFPFEIRVYLFTHVVVVVDTSTAAVSDWTMGVGGAVAMGAEVRVLGGAVDNAYCIDKHNSNGARV